MTSAISASPRIAIYLIETKASLNMAINDITRGRSFKREATYPASGIMTPKEENDVKMDLSNTPEASSAHDGLPRQNEVVAVDEGHRRRSLAPSLASTRISRHATVPIQPLKDHVVSGIPGQSLEKVGENVNMLVEAIEELRKLGLKELDTELPELVLVGDQSSGKSTLMGAITEINLPRDKGMCTRCPANIKTSPGPDWKCTVSLHESYTFTTEKNRRVPTKLQPFPPWIKKEALQVRPFKTISDKSELENILKWAQIALLNPLSDYHLFIPGLGSIAENGLSSDHRNQADFSPNLVAIEISGPHLPALSFFDLPGIFVAAATDEQSYLIKVFENLASEYIRHQNALIICAISMANDPGLSRTSAIIKNIKAGHRTVGVLTMPDRLQAGSTHAEFDAILKDQAHKLPKGYFVTKQPGPDFDHTGYDYHSKARDDEMEYFATNDRFNGEWIDHKSRCGTEAIQNFLSIEFARMIVSSMPSIREKIQFQTDAVQQQLAGLPEPPKENVQHVVRHCLQNFTNGVRGLFEGGTSSHGFLSEWSQLSADFGKVILDMKPLFRLSHPSDVIRTEVINLDDSDEEDSVRGPLVRNKRAGEAIDTSGKRPRYVEQLSGQPVTPVKNEGGSSIGSPRVAPARATVFDRYRGAGKSFMNLVGIQDVIDKHKYPGQPDPVTNAAREEIALKSLQKWNGPLNKLAEETFRMLYEAINGALVRALGNYPKTELYRQSKVYVEEFLDSYRDQHYNHLESFYELESSKLFTINTDSFLRHKAEELQILRETRRHLRVTQYVKAKASGSAKAMTDAAKESLAKTIDDKLLGPDPFDMEVETAGHVRGYYKTAALRFSDNLCQNIVGKLFSQIHRDVSQMLEEKLEINIGDGEAKCRLLMIEDPSEHGRRMRLQEHQAKLKQAHKQLEDLYEGINMEPEPQPDYMVADEDEAPSYLPDRQSADPHGRRYGIQHTTSMGEDDE